MSETTASEYTVHTAGCRMKVSATSQAEAETIAARDGHVVYPMCVRCTGPNHYGDKYDGYCFDCSNAGVPDLVDDFAAARAELERLKGVIEASIRLASNNPDGDIDWSKVGQILISHVLGLENRGNVALDECVDLREQLAAQSRLVDRLREALTPFAYDCFHPALLDNEIAFGGPMVRVGDYRRAAAALTREGE